MKVFVTGGTGFIGSRLLRVLAEGGHRTRLLLRPEERNTPLPAGVEAVVGDPMAGGPWWDAVAECDAAVNLAGYPVFSRWDARVKALIRESRIATTRNLVHALPKGRPFTLLNASGAGIYGDCGEREVDESAPGGVDFLSRVAQEWEAEALTGRERGARVVLARFGIVFGPGGGALPELVKKTRRFLGGPLGSGRQWMPWVHLEDVVRALLFLLERPDLKGPFNFTSPRPARQIDVALTLGRLLHRPALAWAPSPILRLVIGECALVTLFSQKALPKRLLEAGFAFRFPELETALRDILPGMVSPHPVTPG